MTPTEIAELRIDYEGMKLEAFHRGQELAAERQARARYQDKCEGMAEQAEAEQIKIEAQAAEIARLGGLMNERMQMLERYGVMVDQAMAREEIWKTRVRASEAEIEKLRKALSVYDCRCIGPLPDCAQGDIAGCGWTARAALVQP